MKTLQFLFVFLFGALFFVSCDKEDDVEIWPQNQKLQIVIQDQFTTLPAKVSVFFKVQDENGNPVAGLSDADFNIYEKGKNDDAEKLISKDEAARQISSRRQVFAYNNLLVLDLSGSVSNNYLEELKEASISFVNSVLPEEDDSGVQMKIVWFDGDDELHLLADLTDERQELIDAIEGVSADISNDNSTDLYGAVIEAVTDIEQILQSNADIKTAASIVVFTDGTDQASRHAKEEAFNMVNGASDLISFYTIGLGSEIDKTVLTKIGKNAQAFADNTDGLLATFENIAKQIFDEANSFYLFEYCSPKRDGAGDAELRLEVLHDGERGSEIATFNATGFKGGCDL
ncbi:MAG: VWA domain-containing protein [Saprospiraceae bacterium]